MTKVIISTETTRGRVTIPSDVKWERGVGPGDYVAFVLNDSEIQLKGVRTMPEAAIESVPLLDQPVADTTCAWKKVVEITAKDHHAASGRALILVKHAMPIIVPSDPPSTWRLGEEGRAGSRALARLLAAYQPAIVVSSVEPKAAETAEIVAAERACPVKRMPGLHEHERDTVGFLGNQEFHSAMERFFAYPSTLVFGDETADAAKNRFTAALALAIEERQNHNLIVVAHGTVISLYVAAVAGVDALALWGRLGLPSFVALSLPDNHLLDVVESVDPPV